MPPHDAQASSEADQAWEELDAYGRARAKELGITEQDVVPLVRQYRREEREKRASEQPAK